MSHRSLPPRNGHWTARDRPFQETSQEVRQDDQALTTSKADACADAYAAPTPAPTPRRHLNRHPRRRRRRPASSCLALRDATTIFLITRLNDDRSLAVRRLAAFGASSWTTLR